MSQSSASAPNEKPIEKLKQLLYREGGDLPSRVQSATNIAIGLILSSLESDSDDASKQLILEIFQLDHPIQYKSQEQKRRFIYAQLIDQPKLLDAALCHAKLQSIRALMFVGVSSCSFEPYITFLKQRSRFKKSQESLSAFDEVVSKFKWSKLFEYYGPTLASRALVLLTIGLFVFIGTGSWVFALVATVPLAGAFLYQLYTDPFAQCVLSGNYQFYFQNSKQSSDFHASKLSENPSLVSTSETVLKNKESPGP